MPSLLTSLFFCRSLFLSLCSISLAAAETRARQQLRARARGRSKEGAESPTSSGTREREREFVKVLSSKKKSKISNSLFFPRRERKRARGKEAPAFAPPPPLLLCVLFRNSNRAKSSIFSPLSLDAKASGRASLLSLLVDDVDDDEAPSTNVVVFIINHALDHAPPQAPRALPALPC